MYLQPLSNMACHLLLCGLGLSSALRSRPVPLALVRPTMLTIYTCPPAQNGHCCFLDGTFRPLSWHSANFLTRKKLCDVGVAVCTAELCGGLERRARKRSPPTFHFCVSDDDPLSSSGGIKETDVDIIKVHSTTGLVGKSSCEASCDYGWNLLGMSQSRKQSKKQVSQLCRN